MAVSVKVLAVGLGDLVSARNAALRASGFDVVAATCMEEVVEQCHASCDLAIVGHSFSIMEKAQFLRIIQGVFWLPAILITEGRFLATLCADSHIHVDAPTEDLVMAVNRLLAEKKPRAATG